MAERAGCIKIWPSLKTGNINIWADHQTELFLFRKWTEKIAGNWTMKTENSLMENHENRRNLQKNKRVFSEMRQSVPYFRIEFQRHFIDLLTYKVLVFLFFKKKWR